jgi:hypothetical protein
MNKLVEVSLFCQPPEEFGNPLLDLDESLLPTSEPIYPLITELCIIVAMCFGAGLDGFLCNTKSVDNVLCINWSSRRQDFVADYFLVEINTLVQLLS